MSRPNQKCRSLLICALLALVTLVAFWPVFQNDFIKLDDRQYVIENPYVLGGLTWENVKWAFQAGYASNWHPLTWVSHMLDVQFFGLKPGWHHLGNLVLHVANTVLLFLLLQRMTGAVWRSAFVAALFAVHPLHVESVAWVSERKDVLSAFFFMLTLLAYARYAQQRPASNSQRPVSNVEPGEKARGARRAAEGASSPRPSPPEEERERTGSARVYYGLALLLFALGLMSKSMLVTLPFVLLLLDFWPLCRSADCGVLIAGLAKAGCASTRARCWAGLVAEKVPFFALAGLSSVATFLAQARGHNVSVGLPLDSRMANAVASYLKYLGKTVWPADLAVFYPHPDIRYPVSHQWTGWAIALAALLLVAISAAAVLRLKREPWLATGWFWYLGTLVPVIGLVQVGGQGMADRYTYIPLIGIFVCVVWGAGGVFAGWRPGRAGLATAAALVVAACMVATRNQVQYWRSNFTLFEHVLAVTTDNAVAEYHVGTELEGQQKYEQALTHFRAALKYDPGYVDAYCSLGFTLSKLGRADEAFEQYQAAIKLRPWHAPARVSLGALLWMRGQRSEAVEQYAEALRLRPDLPEAHFNMGVALSGLGQLAEAAGHLAEALRLRPDYPEARALAAEVLVKQGKLREAEKAIREIERLYPTNAEAVAQLGSTLTMTGRTNEADGPFASAMRLEPDLAEKHVREGKSLAEQGQTDAAVGRFITAVRLKPDDADAREHLGLLWARQGKLDEAGSQFEEMVRLRRNAQAFYDLGRVRFMQGRIEEAATNYQEAVRLGPGWPAALNNRAWILATASDPRLRDGSGAVSLAIRACTLTGFKEAVYVGTLAAAYAEAGRFRDAVRTAEEARDLAAAAGKKELVEKNRQLVGLYQAGTPYHEAAPPQP